MMPCGPKIGRTISGTCVSIRPSQRIRKKFGMIVTSSGTISADRRNSMSSAAPAKRMPRQRVAGQRGRGSGYQHGHRHGDVERVEILPRERLVGEDLDEVLPVPDARDQARAGRRSRRRS